MQEPERSGPSVWSIGLASFCLSQPGQAEIEGVDLIGGGGLEVQAFATKPGPPEFFFDPVTLDGSGIGTGTTVSQVCDDTIDFETIGPDVDLSNVVAAVYVQFARVSEGPGTAQSVAIRWRSEEESGTLAVPISVALCDRSPCDEP